MGTIRLDVTDHAALVARAEAAEEERDRAWGCYGEAKAERDERQAEAVAKLDAMTTRGDTEVIHGEADAILCDVLRAMGAADVAEAFERAQSRVGFWYA